MTSVGRLVTSGINAKAGTQLTEPPHTVSHNLRLIIPRNEATASEFILKLTESVKREIDVVIYPQ